MGKHSASTVLLMLGFPDGSTPAHLTLLSPVHTQKHSVDSTYKPSNTLSLGPSQDLPSMPLDHSPLIW